MDNSNTYKDKQVQPLDFLIRRLGKKSIYNRGVICLVIFYLVLLLAVHSASVSNSDPLLLLQQQQTGETITETTPTTTAIFFNVFLPPGETRPRAIEITKSQVADIKKSHLQSSHVFATALGDTTDAQNLICQDLPNCKLIGDKPEGDEKETLIELYQYCTQHTNDVVIYLHNKGSFHDNPENSALRQMHMRAQVQTKDCTNAITADLCNVCSARFSPLPHFHTSGNMWTAQCSYVIQLASPHDFQDKMEQTINSLKNQPHILNEMFPCTGTVRDCVDIAHIGMERYSAEHWIHSHPTVRPCDVLPTNYTFVWNYNNIPPPTDMWTPQLNIGPRFSMEHYLNNNYLPKNTKWFTIKGRLFEWSELYKQIPSKDSWVWFYYGTLSWL